MADNVHHSFENLSLNRPSQHQQHAGHQISQLGSHANSNGTMSSQASSSLRSPSGSYGGATQTHIVNSGNMTPGSVGDGQSAAARFERFFKASSPTPQAIDLNSGGGLGAGMGGYAHHSPASIGPGSSAAGLAHSGAFGSFGHSINVGTGQAPNNVPSGMFSHTSTAPALRSKPSGMRQGIPTQWGSGGGVGSDDYGTLGGIGSSPSPPHHYNNATAASGMYAASGANAFPGVSTNVNAAMAGSPLQDDDIIPTAIVVKNIPFSIKREQLLQIIEDLQIPMPYAFNYHFDQGVFRGLAFANFRSGEEADAVVAALNGFDVSGRKLRVEYKKVLQAGEKERIEKEKAIKRMQSMQIEKERVRRQTVTTGTGEDWNAHFGGAPPVPTLPSGSKSTNVDVDSGYADALGGVEHQAQTQGQNVPELVHPASESQTDLAAGAASELAGRKDELDLNDSATLEIYSRVLLFKDDRMRDELSFSKNLTTNERRIVHMVSKKLGLYHYSLGDGEERYVIVTKNEVNQSHRPLRSQASTIGRSNRGTDGLVGRDGALGGNGLLSPGSSLTVGRSGLRTKKSAPDMKRQRERSEDGAFSGHTYGFHSGGMSNGLHGSYTAGLSRKSNGNLREGYSSSTGRRSQPNASGNAVGGAAGLQNLFSSPFDVPPVPALPAHSPGGEGFLSHSNSPLPIGTQHSANGSLSAASSQNILRQPAGPGAANRNFAQRSRVPLMGGAFGEGVFGNGGSAKADDSHASSLGPATSGGNGGDEGTGAAGELRQDDVQSHQPLEV